MTDTTTIKSSSKLIDRMEILIRFVYIIVFYLALYVTEMAFGITVLFQFIHLLIFQRINGNLQKLSNHLATYIYKINRFQSFNVKRAPFPMQDLPKELDKPENPIFDKN